MDERNPYAPSKASLTQSSAPDGRVSSQATAWRYGTLLVLVPDTALPDRCVKCNEPAHAPTKTRTVYWHHPGVYLLILVNIIIYAIVGAIVRKRARVAPGLCQAHKKKHRIALVVSWTALLCGVGLIFSDIAFSSGGSLVGIGVLLLLVAIIVGLRASRIVYAQKIEPSRVWLRGCGGEFLGTLPELPND